MVDLFKESWPKVRFKKNFDTSGLNKIGIDEEERRSRGKINDMVIILPKVFPH